MKNIILIAIILAAGWYLYKQYGPTQLSSIDSSYKNPTKCITKDGQTLYGDLPQGTVCAQEIPVEGTVTVMSSRNSSKVATSSFRCDGRTYCSQMTSCEEATFFL